MDIFPHAAKIAARSDGKLGTHAGVFSGAGVSEKMAGLMSTLGGTGAGGGADEAAKKEVEDLILHVVDQDPRYLLHHYYHLYHITSRTIRYHRYFHQRH